MKNEDKLIRASDLKLAIRDDININGKHFAIVRKHIDEAEPVDAVEVVHGRWIHDCVEGCNPFVDSLPIWVDVMQCSVCKEYIEGSHGSNYCPNCGAKMDGDKNGE